MKKGFYLIGKDKENSKTFVLGLNPERFDTFKQAEKRQEVLMLELLNDSVKIEILEVWK